MIYVEGFDFKNPQDFVNKLIENFRQLRRVAENRKLWIPFRIAEGRGSSTATGWADRLMIATRLPEYLGFGIDQLQRVTYCATIGLKADGTNTVKGKTHFSFADYQFVQGPEHTTTSTDWQYWVDKVEIGRDKLLDIVPPNLAVQSLIKVWSSGGTNYYYAGYSFLLVDLI